MRRQLERAVPAHLKSYCRKFRWRSKQSNYPLVRYSSVENLDLVSSTANIRNSRLQGHILVEDYSLILESTLSGNISISEHSRIIQTHLSGNICVGRWLSLNGPNTDIFSLINRVTIGNFCAIARNVSIQEYNHPLDRCTTYSILPNIFAQPDQTGYESKGDIIIENDVWIGTQAVILSGAHISTGAVIGANSVVSSYIPPYAIAVGSPAKVIRFRFDDEIIRALLETEWWNWDDERIKNNQALFTGPLTREKIDQIR